MAKDKRSFFERLTGSIRLEDDSDLDKRGREKSVLDLQKDGEDEWLDEGEEEINEGELTVDVYQTPAEIIIKTMIAGVKPEDLDINITRDMVTIKGRREGDRSISGENYFLRELYWGNFSRSIVLPQEVDPEESEAIEKHGLLIIRMPKVNKDRQTKLRVKTI